jgi:hypothetical protein
MPSKQGQGRQAPIRLLGCDEDKATWLLNTHESVALIGLLDTKHKNTKWSMQVEIVREQYPTIPGGLPKYRIILVITNNHHEPFILVTHYTEDRFVFLETTLHLIADAWPDLKNLAADYLTATVKELS